MAHNKKDQPRICFTHPKYKALRKPRVLCEKCWRGWHNPYLRINAQDRKEKKKTLQKVLTKRKNYCIINGKKYFYICECKIKGIDCATPDMWDAASWKQREGTK